MEKESPPKSNKETIRHGTQALLSGRFQSTWKKTKKWMLVIICLVDFVG
jgi:hypothetical protein